MSNATNRCTICGEPLVGGACADCAAEAAAAKAGQDRLGDDEWCRRERERRRDGSVIHEVFCSEVA